MAYEIWETSTRNLVADFPSEEEALDVVRKTLRKHGAGHVSTWLLTYEDENATTSRLAAGMVLVARAQTARD